MTPIDILQRRLEDALHALVGMHEAGSLPPVLQPLLTIAPPPNLRTRARLRSLPQPDNDDGSRSRDEYWDPRDGEVWIRYVEDAELTTDADGNPVADLVTVLGDAERNPHLHFVALKFLRDRLLPQTSHAWVRSPHACQRAIADAIERGVLLTTKKPNPRNPSFPVTAVQLNRKHPLVEEMLIDNPEPSTEFEPVVLRGDDLSTDPSRGPDVPDPDLAVNRD